MLLSSQSPNTYIHTNKLSTCPNKVTDFPSLKCEPTPCPTSLLLYPQSHAAGFVAAAHHHCSGIPRVCEDCFAMIHSLCPCLAKITQSRARCSGHTTYGMILGKSVRLYMFHSAYSLAKTKRNEMRGSQPSLDCLPTSTAKRKMVTSTILSPTCNTYASAE